MTPLDTRTVDRESLFLVAEIAVAGAEKTVPVKVRNLSAAGMMVVGELQASAGQRIRTELRNIGVVEGTVVWVCEQRCGIAFDKEVDPKLARTQVTAGDSQVPRYARAALTPRRAANPEGAVRPT